MLLHIAVILLVLRTETVATSNSNGKCASNEVDIWGCCPDYHFNGVECLPLCKDLCINSKCTWPNVCTCETGYEPTIDSHRCRSICDDGFLYNELTKQCDSICPVPCTNGACKIIPYNCVCNRGFHKNINGNCVKNECDPRLRDECVHGTCSSNGICECDDGFIKNYDTLECDPKCSGGCLNGYCESPDNCICDPHYKAINSSVCSPICDEECVFGTCTAPNTCTCRQNYQPLTASNHICKPICSGGCANGSTCVSPDVCSCDIGFEYNEVNGCIKKSCTTYCAVCQCVDSIFGHSFAPMSVSKLCYTMMLATSVVIIILSLCLVFSYRRYIKRINRPFNPTVVYRKLLDK